jgi:hypothetical protein
MSTSIALSHCFPLSCSPLSHLCVPDTPHPPPPHFATTPHTDEPEPSVCHHWCQWQAVQRVVCMLCALPPFSIVRTSHPFCCFSNLCASAPSTPPPTHTHTNTGEPEPCVCHHGGHWSQCCLSSVPHPSFGIAVTPHSSTPTTSCTPLKPAYSPPPPHTHTRR